MARIVSGFGASHTPMLNATLDDWRHHFGARDRARSHRDREGQPVSYEELLARADPGLPALLREDAMAQRFADAAASLAHLAGLLDRAPIDALIVVGDDQDELYHRDNQPAFLVYWGDTIPNAPRHRAQRLDPWYARAAARYYDDPVRHYPVDAALARHLISALVEQEFDVAAASAVPDGEGEGHAFAFVHRRLMTGRIIPIVPVFVNTYYPPNQPGPARCHRLGQALRKAVEGFAEERRVGILASGGLSHFTVDEDLDREVIRALREKDGAALRGLPPRKLEAGSSEIRNWICLAGAVEGLDLRWVRYIPGYRSPAGTGTGICFAWWA